MAKARAVGVAGLVLACSALQGCPSTMYAGSTALEISGEVCGRQLAVRLHDGKERGTFVAKCTTSPDGSATVTIETVESKAFDGQAEAARLSTKALELGAAVVQKALGIEKLVTPGVP